MDMLLQSYRNDEAAIEEIIAARKALVDLYITTVRYALTAAVKSSESEISLDAYDAAVKGVKTLNAMCMEKGIEPVYTGSYTKSHDLFRFAEEFTMGIYKKACAGQ